MNKRVYYQLEVLELELGQPRLTYRLKKKLKNYNEALKHAREFRFSYSLHNADSVMGYIDESSEIRGVELFDSIIDEIQFRLWRSDNDKTPEYDTDDFRVTPLDHLFSLGVEIHGKK